MARPAARRLWGLTALALVLCLAVTAGGRQDPSGPGPAPAPAANPSNLFVLVHVKNKELRPDQLRGTFRAALKVLRDPSAEVHVQSLEPDFFRSLQDLTENLNAIGSGVPKDKPFVRQKKATGGKVEWELNLNRKGTLTGLVVRELEIFLADKDGKEKGKKTLKPTGTGPDAEMSPTPSRDVFIVRLPATEVPKRFIVRGVHQKKDVELSGPWGETERYYLVMLKNFSGNHKELMETIKKKTMPAPLTDAVVGQGLTFLFASAGFTLPVTGSFSGNEYIPFMSQLPERENVRRVWMLFPLTEEQAEKELKRYQKFDVDTLPAEIRKNNPAWADENPVLTVSDKTPARWIELPSTSVDGRAGFSRRVRLENFRGLHAKYPAARRLLVYEYMLGDDPRKPDLIQAVGVPSKETGEQVFLVNEEIKEWPAGIAKLAGTAGGKDGKDGKDSKDGKSDKAEKPDKGDKSDKSDK